ncbi:MAG: class I SAM-dependent methyltransferase [Gammaproteobacteria bacterium]|nr:class I SAM-dependent methyltransferase [Gammaproteobacteria bacterium]
MSTVTAKTVSQASIPSPAEIRARVKAVWESGDYARFAKYLEPGALQILDELAIEAGENILDVACGAGQIAIPSARKGAKVTGLDIADNLVQAARQRAEAEGIEIRFDQGDACELPYSDNQFDRVYSLIGAMFAPYPQQVANELVRVVRPGGKIQMINWTPEGMVGEMLRTVSRYAPPPAGVVPPTLWGNEETVLERFGEVVEDIKLKRNYYPEFNYPFAPQKVADWFIDYYGPTHRAYQATAEERRDELRNELSDIFSRYNTRHDGTTSLKAEYLAVSATKR